MDENKSDRRDELLAEVRSKANSLRLALTDYLGEGFFSQDARVEVSSVLRQVDMVVVDRNVLLNFVAATREYVGSSRVTVAVSTSFR